MPTIVPTTCRDSLWGPTIPELTAVLPDVEIIDRITVNAWDEPPIVRPVCSDQLLVLGGARRRGQVRGRPRDHRDLTRRQILGTLTRGGLTP